MTDPILIDGKVTDLEFVSQSCQVSIRPATATGAMTDGDDVLVGVIIRLYPEDDLDDPIELPGPGYYHCEIQRRGGPQDFDTIEFDFQAVEGQPLSWRSMLDDAERVAQILLSGKLSRDALTSLINQIFSLSGAAQSVVADDVLPEGEQWRVFIGLTPDDDLDDFYTHSTIDSFGDNEGED